jgi:Bacterial cadherin-like domain
VLSVSPTSTSGGRVTAIATVTLNVTTVPAPPSTSPIAVNDVASMATGGPAAVDVLANDSDINIPGSGQVLTAASFDRRIHLTEHEAAIRRTVRRMITAAGMFFTEHAPCDTS